MPEPIVNNEKNNESSIETIYNTINDVLNGTDSQQMLCLTIHRTVLDKKSYIYDIRFEKPITVAANESLLANKLYDVTKVADSDNGRQVSTQFISALDALTPTLNTKLMEAKDHSYIYEFIKIQDSLKTVLY